MSLFNWGPRKERFICVILEVEQMCTEVRQLWLHLAMMKVWLLFLSTKSVLSNVFIAESFCFLYYSINLFGI